MKRSPSPHPVESGIPIPEHYNVKRFTLVIELERFNPVTGRAMAPLSTDPIMIFEDEFNEGIVALFRSKGLNPANFPQPSEIAGDPHA